MHSTITFSTLALAVSSNVFAAPLQARQTDPNTLILADTFQFVAKTLGDNPNPDVLPDINNYLFVPIHSGAGTNLATLVDPTTYSFDLSNPGYFRNGTDVPHGQGGYVTVGVAEGLTYPYSIVTVPGPQEGSSNPGATQGPVEFNIGLGTSGIDLPVGQLITSRYVTDDFWACPNIPVEGGTAIAVIVTDRYANAPEGCWGIRLFAQCAGPISDANRDAFPAFVQSSCFANATEAYLTDETACWQCNEFAGA